MLFRSSTITITDDAEHTTWISWGDAEAKRWVDDVAGDVETVTVTPPDNLDTIVIGGTYNAAAGWGMTINRIVLYPTQGDTQDPPD